MGVYEGCNIYEWWNKRQSGLKENEEIKPFLDMRLFRINWFFGVMLIYYIKHCFTEFNY